MWLPGSMQEAVGPDHIVDVARRASHGVHKTRVGIHTDVGIHPEEPLVALLALVHLRGALPVLVLGRTQCSDQRGIDHRAGVEQQAVDQREDLIGQFVALQQVAESKDRALVGQPAVSAQAGELAQRRHVVQGLFHRWVAEGEPLLHEVDAQHRLHCKGWAAFLSFGGIRRHQFNERRPRHHAFHLREKLPLARALGRQVQAQISLLHGLDRKQVAGRMMQSVPRAGALLWS